MEKLKKPKTPTEAWVVSSLKSSTSRPSAKASSCYQSGSASSDAAATAAFRPRKSGRPGPRGARDLAPFRAAGCWVGCHRQVQLLRWRWLLGGRRWRKEKRRRQEEEKKKNEKKTMSRTVANGGRWCWARVVPRPVRR
jgi:hypothetical protein